LRNAADLSPGMLISKTYRIVRKLGDGGLGAVYLTALAQNKQRRVLQFLNGEMSRDDAFTSSFQQVARTLSKLDHKNVVASGALETAEDGTQFFAMEYVDGQSLRELLSTAACAFDVNLSIAIARGIAEGLSAGHARGMIHLDLKPENILIARHGETLVPKISRFGIGAVRENKETYLPAGRILLTPTYAAPEQWLDTRPADLDARADLYALGGVFFELLTGQTVFDAVDYHSWARQHLNAAPRLPSSLRSDLAAWHGLDNLVLALLAKNRDDRPKDTAEVIQLLDAVQHGYRVLEAAPVHIVEDRVADDRVQDDRAPVDRVQAPLAPVSEYPAPANTAELPASLGGSFTGWDTEEEPNPAPELPASAVNLPEAIGTEDQDSESSELPGLLDGDFTKWDVEEPATVPEPQQPSTHPDVLPDESADTIYRPSLDRITEELSGDFLRSRPVNRTGEVSRIAGGWQSFLGNAPAGKDNEDEPRETSDYHNFLLRDPPIKGTANESETTEEIPISLAGAGGPVENKPDTQPEHPDFYDHFLADTPVEQKYRIPAGMPSTLDRPEQGNDTGDFPGDADEQPVLSDQLDDDAAGNEEAQRPGGYHSLIGDVGLERSIDLVDYEDEEDDTSPHNSGRKVWVVLSAFVVLAVAGIAMWRFGFIDPNRPIARFGKSCDAGNAKACFDLAAWYEQTNTVKDGDLEAATYYSKACEAAYPQACRKLGFKYLFGNGIPRDNSRAMDLFSQACDQNDNDGCDTLADIYHEGKGVKVDDKKAAELYGKACAAGDDFGCKWEKKLEVATTPVKPARHASGQ
jgi:serine/threonine-protein kinase